MAKKLADANVTDIRSRQKAPTLPKEGEGPAPIGDNAALTAEQEARALRIHHVSKLVAQKRLVDKAKALLDEQRDALSDLYKLAKVDTKIDRKQFTALLADMETSRKDLEAAERTRVALRTDWDLPVGTQMDLFDRMPQEKQDEAWAKSVGYKFGLRGDPCQMPEDIEPRFGPAFLAGHGKGQEELIWAMAAAGRITERKKGATGTGPTADEIKRQAEDADDEDESAVL